MADTYTIWAQGKRRIVSEAVYKAYHQHRERERYLINLAQEHERSLERFADDGVNVEYQYAASRPSMEDEILHQQHLVKLRECFAKLDKDDQTLLDILFNRGKSESEAGQLLGVSQQAINKQKFKIITKLKQMMKV